MTKTSESGLYIAITVIALVSWIVLHRYEESSVKVVVAENSPDFFSFGYTKKQLNLEGRPRNELKADAMQHYKADGSSHLEKPFMILYNSSGVSPWVIKSEIGVMAADGDNLQLLGLTNISREASANNAALMVNTADLHVKLDSNYAETSARADIISLPNKTTGEGMEITFVSPVHLKLLSKVKGRYELK